MKRKIQSSLIICQYTSSNVDRVSVFEDTQGYCSLWKKPGKMYCHHFCNWRTSKFTHNIPKVAMRFASCVQVNWLLTCNLTKCEIIFACSTYIKTIKILCTPEFFKCMICASHNVLYQNQVPQSELKWLKFRKLRVFNVRPRRWKYESLLLINRFNKNQNVFVWSG